MSPRLVTIRKFFSVEASKSAWRRASILSGGIAALLLATLPGRAQTYTSPSSGTFTNPQVWNFGAGPVPASDAALALSFQSFGTGAITAANDLNLTLNELDLATFGTGALTLSGTLGGGYAFSGGAGKINLLGSSAGTILSAPVVLAQGLSSLTFSGTGPAGVGLNGIISSNTNTGAPLVIATDASGVGLNAANTFAGGVVLNSGTLSLNSTAALGARTNTLTVNGGSVRGSVSIANNVLLNTTLKYLGTTSLNPTIFTGVLSGSGGVTNAASGSVTSLGLTGVNPYTGATTVRGPDNAVATAADGSGIITINGAVGSILNTSGINVSEGGEFRLNYNLGNSATNARVSTSVAITANSGFVEVIGNAGVVRQNLGTLNAGGFTTIFASTNAGGSTVTAGAATEVTIANLVRTTGSSVLFTGPNLGGAGVAPGLAAAQGNVLLTQINGLAPASVLIGGGAAGTPDASIIPWSVGDTANFVGVTGNGTGFVTYGANGVRLLDTTNEYNTSNNFVTAGTTHNMRVTGVVIDPLLPTTVNSVFFAATGQTIGGANALTISSGALASNVATASISAPLNFGAGPGIVSVVGGLSAVTPNTMTLSGAVTAGSLVKSGHGTLVLANAGNAIGGAITVNAGQISVAAVAQLGGATGLVFNGHSDAANRTGLTYTGTVTDTLSAPISTNGAMAGFTVASASGTLNLNSNISGAGGVRKDGDGTLVLGGTNNYTGGTYLGKGTLQIDSDARLGHASGFLGLTDGTLRLTGNWTSARPINVGVNVNLDTQSSSATLSGPIGGGGNLFKFGAGTLTITSGDNSFSGLLQMGDLANASGIVALSGAGALNSANVQIGTGATSVAGTYVLDFSGATGPNGTPWRSLVSLTTGTGFTPPHEVKLGAGAGAPVDLRVDSGTFGGAAGVLSGFGKLVKAGTGTLTLNGTVAGGNTFTGGVELWGGALAFGADNQLGNAGNGVAIKGGILNNTAMVTTSRAIALGATPQPIISASTIQTLANGINTAAALTLNGGLSGAGGFNKSGAGTLTLGAASNSYAGDTQITAGALAFSDNPQLGAAASRLLFNGGTLQLAAAPTGATTYTVNRTAIFTADSIVDVPSANAALDLSGAWVGTATLTKTGAGRLTVSGNNPSFVSTLFIGNGSAATGNVILASTGQLRRANIFLAASSGATFDMSGLTRDFSGLDVAAGTAVALGTSGKLTTGLNNFGVSWFGSITGGATASFTKIGSGTLSLTSNTNTLAGGVHLLSGTGNTTTFSLNGTLPLQSAFTIGAWGSTANRGPVLILDNTGTNLGTRLADTQAIHSNSGEIQFSTNTTTATSETAGSLRGAGTTIVTMTTGGTLNFGDAANGLTRVNGGTFLFRSGGSSSMGGAAASTTRANITFGNSASLGLVGGGGSTATNVSILPYATGVATATGTGSNLVTYGANGIRLLLTAEFNQNLLTAAADDNVWVNPAAGAISTLTLSGGTNKTINAVLMSGSAFTRIESATSEKLIITSGTFVNANIANVFTTNANGTAGLQLGIQSAELQTGNSNTRELNVWTNSIGHLAIGAKVTTSGGLTKSGPGRLYLTNSANSYTSPTTVNAGSLVIDNLAALGASNTLQMGGGFLEYRGADATLTPTVLAAGGSASNPGGSAGFHVVSGTTLTVPAGGVSGFGGVLKEGTGVLKLQGTNTNSGAAQIGAGALAIDSPAALGTNGTVVFTDSTLSSNGGATLRFDAPMTLTQDFITNGTGAGVGFGFDTNGRNVTLTGTMLKSTRGLHKFGAGELNLTATQQFTGAAQVFGGTLRLSGANGSLLDSTGTGGFNNTATVLVNPGSALVLDNAAANNNNRLPDVWDTPFGTGNGASGKLRLIGGELKIIGHAAGTSERVNQLDLQRAGTITLEGGGTVLTSGALSRPNAQTGALIRGTNLGGTPGPGSANYFVTDLGSGGVQLGGAGGAKGTPFVNIVSGFMGDASATGKGTDLLTYSADTGFRALTAGEYTGAIPANNFDLNRAPNVALTGAASVNQTTAITALKLGAGASVGGSGTLVLGQQTVLATGSASLDVTSLSTNVSGANAGYVFLTPGAATTLSMSSLLPSAGLVKSGEGTLAFSGRYLGAGNANVVVAQGMLQLVGAAAALNPLSTGVFILPGATLDLGGSDRTIGRLDTLSAVGSFNLGQVSDGTVALGANRLSLYESSSTFTGNITGTGGLSKPLNSSGTNTFTQPLAYTGSTVIRAGVLQLAGAGTLASSAVELRGGTLHFNNSDDSAAAGGYVANRIGTATPVLLAGGTIQFTENVSVPANHSLGPVTLAGGGTLTISQTSVTAPSTTTIANLTRAAAKGTLNVSAGTLGLAQNPTGNARIFLTQIDSAAPAGAFIGGSGGVDTATQKILPWAYSTTAASLLTYGADGLRPLAPTEYEAGLDAPSGPTVNIRTTTAQILSAPRSVNALLVTNGDVSGAHNLTVTSGALAISAATTVLIGDSTRTLLTGDAGSGPNTRELVINADGTGTHVLNYNVTTSGGLTKFGSQPLVLAGSANTFTGGLTINQGPVHFTSDAQLGAAGGVVRFGGTSALLRYAGSTAATIDWNRPVETTGGAQFSNLDPALVRWIFNQPISGSGGVTYSKSAGGSIPVYELHPANTYTGFTQWTAGQLYIQGDSAFGNGGELLLATNDLTNNIVLRGNWNSNRLIHAAETTSAGAIQTNGFEATWNGQLIGSTALHKNGAGGLTLTEPMPYTGVLTVNAGAVRLRDRGSIAANVNTVTVGPGAALTLDDSGAHFSDRLHDSSGGVTMNGGTLELLGNGGATTEEVINNVTLNNGTASTVTVAAGSGQAAILRLAGTLTANAGSSLFRGTNLGVNAPATANTASILINGGTVTTGLIGGGAPAGHPAISIIRGAFGDTSATGLGTQLVTYDPDKGIRLLNPATEFTTTLVNGSVVSDNVNPSNLALANATTANALWLKDGASVSGAGTLTLTAGNLLATGTGNTIANPITAGSNALAVGGPGDVTLGGVVSGTGGLIKQGAGRLTLNVANSYSGGTVLAAGVTEVGNAGAFSSTTVRMQGGEIRNSSSGPLTLANAITLSGPLMVGGTQDLTFSSTVSLASATREINVTNTGVTTISGVISSSQTLINYGLTKTGPGLLVLSNAANTYDGETTVTAGELRISGSIAASTLTTVASGTLSGTGTVGALRTTGGTLAPGTSVGTLNSGSVTFSGGTFSIEISSATLADKLMVMGTAGLAANTALTLSLLGGYVPTGNESWTIIDNDAADAFTLGTFRFTNAGTPIDPLVPFTTGGVGYYLDYAGGSSANDVVLHVVPEPGTAALLTAALALLALRRRR